MVAKYEPKFLDDDPVEEDLLGGHQKVAEAIANTVLHTKGGKSIALTGVWGSGKSTVIKILEKLFYEPKNCGDNKVAVFKFNAWEHKEDTLRRCFLASLSEFMQQKVKWCEAKDDIVTKIEKLHTIEDLSHQTQDFELGIWEAITILSLYLLPLAYIFFNNYYFSEALYGLKAIIIVLTSSLIILAPLIIAYFKPNTFSILLNKVKEKKITLTTRTLEPTSLEFQDLFIDLLGKCLSPSEETTKKQRNNKNQIKYNRKLIIVMDNLDRLSSDEALSIWSTMRSFFHEESQQEHSWFSNLWLIVPFDIDSMQKVLALGNKQNSFCHRPG